MPQLAQCGANATVNDAGQRRILVLYLCLSEGSGRLLEAPERPGAAQMECCIAIVVISKLES
jgi:hypothetical protein